MLSAKRGLQFGQEDCGPWSRACLVVSGLLLPLEAGTHATSVWVRRKYHVPQICSELFQCAILIFSFGAKCELGGCVLLAWLHTLPTYCHQFNDTICICALICCLREHALYEESPTISKLCLNINPCSQTLATSVYICVYVWWWWWCVCVWGGGGLEHGRFD